MQYRASRRNYINGHPKRKDYVYMLREKERKLDRKGSVQSVESRTSEVMILRRHTIERPLEKKDRPLSERESAREERKSKMR